MKKLFILLALSLNIESSMAANLDQQELVLRELQMAKMEVEMVKNLLPEFYQRSLGANLADAAGRMTYAISLLNTTVITRGYYCTVSSSFDGNFSGRGKSELEAKDNALAACKRGSRANGWHCNDDYKCVQE